MQVTNELIEELAGLSALEFSPSEFEQIRNDLQKMIGFIEQLKELDTDNIEPLEYMGAMNEGREDTIKGMITREEGLSNAAHKNEKFILVPKVIRKQP
ncbi:MAG: gatC [Chitinophagaceae bacterium]|nr:gatC [Chitinophagaceae bacterium]